MPATVKCPGIVIRTFVWRVSTPRSSVQGYGRATCVRLFMCVLAKNIIRNNVYKYTYITHIYDEKDLEKKPAVLYALHIYFVVSH